MNIENKLNKINSIEEKKNIRNIFINRLKIELNENNVNIEIVDDIFMIHRDDNVFFQINKNKIDFFNFTIYIIDAYSSIIDIEIMI